MLAKTVAYLRSLTLAQAGLLYGVVGYGTGALFAFVPVLSGPTADPEVRVVFGQLTVTPLHTLVHIVIACYLFYGLVGGRAAERLVARTLLPVFALLAVGQLVPPVVDALALSVGDTGVHVWSGLLATYPAFFADKYPYHLSRLFRGKGAAPAEAPAGS